MKQKPYQWLAWAATSGLLLSASLASIVPDYHWHHVPFIVSNALWALTGVLWKEYSLIVLNVAMVLIYSIGLLVN